VSIPPDKEHQAVVIAKLTPLLKDFFAKEEAAKALGVWGDDATERKFIGSFLSTPRNERRLIFAMLGKRNTVTAARAVAGRLRVAEDAHEAERTLKEMGPVAEPAVRVMLSDPDKKVKSTAIGILKEIGTKESVQALQPLTKHPDAAVSFDAQQAIRAIEDRTK
jgi:hypothetical protein